MVLGIQSHLTSLLLSNTVDLLDSLGVLRSQKAIHDWVHKADLQPNQDAPNQIVLDEIVIRITDQQYWLYAVADPKTNQLLHVWLFSTTALTEMLLRELRQKHHVETSGFLVDDAQPPKQRSSKLISYFIHVDAEIETLSNVSFKK